MTNARTIRQIELEIENAKLELMEVHGSTTEVYARITGYYRPVRNWNKGKKEEFSMRKNFTLGNEEQMQLSLPSFTPLLLPDAVPDATAPIPSIYEIYTRKTCPSCPSVKQYMDSFDIAGVCFDADTEEGLKAAKIRGVMATPTVIFFDDNMNELFRCHSVDEIKSYLN